MEFYNIYIKPPLKFNSKISFVGCNHSISMKDIFYVQFHNEDVYRSGFFTDQDGFLMTLSKSFKWAKIKGGQDFHHELIKEVADSKRYHSIIMIEEDKVNPQLVGQFMLFKFGKAIFDKIINVKDPPGINTTYLKRTFHLNIEYRAGFPDYSKCFFGNEEPELCNSNSYGIKYYSQIDLDKEIKYKVFNLKHYERKLKLEQIQKNLWENFLKFGVGYF